jgi:DNA polymerase-3 subunit chi
VADDDQVEPPGGHALLDLLFDGNDPDAVDAARDNWKEAQGEGFETIYWQQDATGRWQKKA